MRRNYHLWAGVMRPHRWTNSGLTGSYPTLVVDVDLASWALPMAIHAGGPLLGKPGFHVRIGPINIGWSKL